MNGFLDTLVLVQISTYTSFFERFDFYRFAIIKNGHSRQIFLYFCCFSWQLIIIALHFIKYMDLEIEIQITNLNKELNMSEKNK